jgi:hypothetical protein
MLERDDVAIDLDDDLAKWVGYARELGTCLVKCVSGA